MSAPSRRDFLQVSLGAAGAALLGTVPLERLAPNGVRVEPCPDPFAAARRVATIQFSETQFSPPFHTLIDAGLDARLYTDLSTLGPDSLVTLTSKFFVRTSCPDFPGPGQEAASWRIRASGQVHAPMELSLRDLEPLAEPTGPFLMECAGNNDPANFGLMSAATWSGAPMARVLEKLRPLARGTRVRISGFDQHSRPARSSLPGASWIFTIDELESAGAILAIGMNGEPLTRDHGWPVRLVMPRWYGCTCIKWVNEIALVDDQEPATPQMKEFAARTHQHGKPELARDYQPAAMDLAALPVRIEKWMVRGKIAYRVVGIMWGGTKPVTRLRTRFNPSEPYVPFDICPPPKTTDTWTMWSFLWKPKTPGRYQIVLQPDDAAIPSQRLGMYFYVRQVWIDEV